MRKRVQHRTDTEINHDLSLAHMPHWSVNRVDLKYIRFTNSRVYPAQGTLRASVSSATENPQDTFRSSLNIWLCWGKYR